VLGLGMWIAFGPTGQPRFPTAPGSLKQTIQIGSTRGVLEAFRVPAAPDAAADYHFRIWMKGGPAAPQEMTRAEAEASWLGTTVVEETLNIARNPVFRALKITSWTSIVWVGIGLIGQLAFSGRMVLQWIVSEKKRESVITESFWWFSLFGGVTLFSYFVWRQEPIGILGQASGIVIYIRNIRLIYKQKRRLARAVGLIEARPEEVDAPRNLARPVGTGA
jgi:lipid-A-disaccharide synthase-like uncharacterized protein